MSFTPQAETTIALSGGTEALPLPGVQSCPFIEFTAGGPERQAAPFAITPALLPKRRKAKTPPQRLEKGTTRRTFTESWSNNQASECAYTLSDRDLMVTLLSRCLSLTAAARATEVILERYGSYAEAVAAPFAELMAIPAIGETAATLLKCVHSSVARLTSIPLRQAPVLNNWATLSAYLNVCIGRERNEFCRVLFLNAKNHLISDQILSEGDVSSVSVPIRTITRRALELGATALILVHNHPSGDPTPSKLDIAITQQVEHAVAVFGIVVHDHIIVGKSECFSLKNDAYMPSYQPTVVSH